MAVSSNDPSLSVEAWAIATRLAPLPVSVASHWHVSSQLPAGVAGDAHPVWWLEDESSDYSRWCREGGSLVSQSLSANGLLVCCYHKGQRYQLLSANRQRRITPEWVAAYLLHDYDLHDAVALAMATTDDTWPHDLSRWPVLKGVSASESAFASCPSSLGLYPVVPSSDWIEKLLALGVRTLQLRCKLSDPQLVANEIRQAVTIAQRFDLPDDPVRLFINDHWALAIEMGAYGVHLGQEDLQLATVSRIRDAGLRLGVSTHGYVEMLRAHALRPSYIAMGAIYATPTKSMPTLPQGLNKLANYVKLMSAHYPLVAIGGISLHEMPAVKATGVGSIAVVRAVTEATDLVSAVDDLQQVMHG